MQDASNGYESIADIYIAGRGRAVNGVGSSAARTWASSFPAGSVILDVGCGTGIPVTNILLQAGLQVYAVDASPAMVAAFRQNFPDVPVACEPAERSSFFDRQYDGIISVGLVFLLAEDDQRVLVSKMATALNPGGRLLFTSPPQELIWADAMTEQESRSLGATQYRSLMLNAGLTLESEFEDEGGNHYFSGTRRV